MTIKNIKEKQRNVVEKIRQEESVEMIQKENSENINVILEDFRMSDLKQTDVKHKNIFSSEKRSGCISIINHTKCGHRIHLANAIWRQLGCPKYVSVFIQQNRFFVMPGKITGIAVRFDRSISYEKAVTDYNGKIILYATETVRCLTKEWGIVFDSSCCYTGGTYRSCTIDGMPAVVVENTDVVEVSEKESEETTEASEESEETTEASEEPEETTEALGEPEETEEAVEAETEELEQFYKN